MLSDVKYNRLAGTAVLRDFVELPSQLMEHWVSEPEVLKKHARHYQTGEPISDDLLAKIKAAANFGQGFGTVEYTACALMDQKLHQLDSVDGLDMAEFEKKELADLNMPTGIVMRHRIPHFTHLFASSGYAALYYVYLWAEVLDADAFDAFVEVGAIFDDATAKRVRGNIYSTGNSVHPMDAYRAFRGRDPVIEPMLKKKGLL
ncbi:peptidyl dipeptidase [Achlya hypogyna]|uniref:Peptidyl dipeptidase n=1 Tax=Achlya hypogyna TaxID=1202772 RepID=A0A1V9Y8B3_ACHHY|nr:peptidyl dipeptidase [Achlya hypogyna]